jgi:MoaA/NifB/PqqE/SkfB family radical SAM enzyme
MKFDGIRKSLHQVNKIRYRPPLVGKIARAYFRRHVSPGHSLRVCEFSITAACQSNCQFCYASKFKKPGDVVLDVEEIRRVWEQSKKMGAFSSVVFGGEPLLHPRFLDIIATLEPKKHLITFTTNAIAMTEELVVELKRLGVFLVNISINSLDATINDTLRGYDGHLDKAMQAMEWCNKHGLDVFLPVVTAKPYWPETLKLIEFADRHGYGVTINLMCPMGRSEGKHGEMFDAEFWSELRAIYDSHPNIRSDYDVNLNMRVGCPSGHEKIHIGPYGDVTGCSMQPASFGNVRSEPLVDIVGRMRAFRHYAKKSPTCLIAMDNEYIHDYMDFSEGYETVPYPIEDNPRYQGDKYIDWSPAE